MWQVGINPVPANDDVVFQIAQLVGKENYHSTDDVQEIERQDGIWMIPLQSVLEKEMSEKQFTKTTALVEGTNYTIYAEMP